jgi:MobA/MobL family
MATTHFARTVFKGGYGGAVHRVQYITRTLPDRAEVQVRHQRLDEGTETVREDLVYWRARNLPSWAQEDAVVFFRAAEQHTSSAWIAYEEWKFSLPREFSRRQQMDAARDFLSSAFGETHPYVWAMHDPVAADGGRQPHVHVLWSPRQLDGIVREPAQFFRRADTGQPARGGAPVNRALTHFGAVKAARVQYTDVMNLHLERAGFDARLHPERLDARGILRQPEPRLSPADSQAFKRGEVTDAMQGVLDHRKRYAMAKSREQRIAREYWEARKLVLGLSREREDGESLARVRAARVRTSREVPSRGEGRTRGIPERETGITDEERTRRLLIPLVGNLESSIYHSPGDPNYGDVHPQKQVLFWTIAEAEDAGFRAAVNQHYGLGAAQHRTEGEGRSRAHTGRSRGRESASRHGASALDRAVAVPRGGVQPDIPHGRAVRVRIFEEEHGGQYGR